MYRFLSEPPDCHAELCASQTIICPSDSKMKPNDHSPSATNKSAFSVYINTQNNNQNETYSIQDISASSRAERAVRPFKRQTIKIVPTDHVNRKRSIDPIETSDNDDNDDDGSVAALITADDTDVAQQQLHACCIRLMCACDTSCTQPTCAPGQVLEPEKDATLVPGQCCAVYRCVTPTAKCYSKAHFQEFPHGHTWIEEPCTECTCDQGHVTCQVSQCSPLSCEKKIYKTGECCPVCDWQDTTFCPGYESCDIVCRNGFAKDTNTGCSMCKCARPTNSNSTNQHHHTATNITSITSTTTTVTSSPTTADPMVTDGDVVQQPPDIIDVIDSKTVMTKKIVNFFERNMLITILAMVIVIVTSTCVLWKFCCKLSKKHSQSYNIVPSA